MKLTATVRDGKLIPDSPVGWTIMLQEFAGKAVVLDVDVPKTVRSIRQNARYFGLIVPLASHSLSKTRDLPLSKDQTHWLLKSAFLGCEETPLGLVPMDSRTLTTKQFHDYCEKIELWLNEQGYHVPEQGEALEI